MFNTSLDLLYIVLAFCILWFTVFVCWLIYQAGRVLKNANRIVENLMQKLELIADAVTFIKKKVDGLSGKMGVVSNLVGGLAEKFVVDKITDNFEDRVASKEKKAKKRKTRKKK